LKNNNKEFDFKSKECLVEMLKANSKIGMLEDVIDDHFVSMLADYLPVRDVQEFQEKCTELLKFTDGLHRENHQVVDLENAPAHLLDFALFFCQKSLFSS
jgi:hypothetical protein